MRNISKDLTFKWRDVDVMSLKNVCKGNGIVLKPISSIHIGYTFECTHGYGMLDVEESPWKTT